MEETNYSNKSSEEKVCTENIWREITTQNSLQRNPYRKSQKSNSRPNKYWREISSKQYLKRKYLPGNFWREITAKRYVTKFSAKESLKRHSLPKAWKEESSRKKSKHVCQNRCDNFSTKNSLKTKIYTKQIAAVTSTEKVLDETFLRQTPRRGISTKQVSKETLTENISGKNLQN